MEEASKNSTMSGDEELKKRVTLLNEENERLKSVLDSTIQVIRRENDAKLADIELHNTQRDAHVRSVSKYRFLFFSLFLHSSSCVMRSNDCWPNARNSAHTSHPWNPNATP
jgi:hypothetical protein